MQENSDMIKHLISEDRIKMINNILNDNLSFLKSKVVADIGAGEGSITRLIANHASKVFAVDNSKNMLIMLQEKCKDLKNVKAILSTTNRINLDDKNVDLAISISSFHDLPNGYEDEMSRILKDNGIAIIIDWKKEKDNQGPPYEIRLSKEVVVNKWKKLGFTVIFKRDYDILYLLVFRR